MAINSRSGTKASEFSRKDSSLSTNIDSGPFIGKIKDNVDPAKLGRIRVYIPELASGDEGDEQFWRNVTYSSPYFGTTVSASETDNSSFNQYGYTRNSYGFWATPPDIGVLVLCIFVGGDPNRGYYIGCLPDPTGHHMVPGLAGNANTTTAGLSPGLIAKTDGESFLPVTEFYDKSTDLATNPDVAKVTKPVHAEQLENLARQGLVHDRTRGVISSSSQRESPSNVFGISTPGRKVLGSDSNSKEVWLRNGGHSLVLDDGDGDGKDNLLRLRTSAGHQIMMNDSDGVIYIINASGKNWIEMGADGSIRAYSEADVSVHATGAINFKSGTSFNVEAPSINLNATNNIGLEAGQNFNLLAGGNVTQAAGKNFGIKGTKLSQVGTTGDIRMSGSLAIVGNGLSFNTGSSAKVDSPPSVPNISIVPRHEPWLSRPAQTTGIVDSTVYKPAVISDSQLAVENAPARKPITRATRTPSYDSTSATATNYQNVDIQQATFDQPNPSKAVGNLTLDQTRALYTSLGITESGGDYRAVNTLGYSGKYQFGCAALEDMGYIKEGTYAKYGRNTVTAQDVWTGKDGINSREDWLNSPQVQEETMERFTARNYRSLISNGGVSPDDDPATVGGMLKFSHLLGAGSAVKWRYPDRYSDSGLLVDGYGTRGDKYFAQGKLAVEGAISSDTVLASIDTTGNTGNL